MEKKQYLEVGKIANTHGIDGRVVIDTWSDSVEDFTKLKTIYLKDGDNYLPKECKSSNHKGRALCKITGIDTMDAAILLKNKTVYANRSDIKISEGAHFIVDLIGLPLIDNNSGITYGTIKDVIPSSSSDIYLVSCLDGIERMMPAVKEYVNRVEEDAIYVSPIPGMLDDNFEKA